jgi:hypothetical protein
MNREPGDLPYTVKPPSWKRGLFWDYPKEPFIFSPFIIVLNMGGYYEFTTRDTIAHYGTGHCYHAAGTG